VLLAALALLAVLPAAAQGAGLGTPRSQTVPPRLFDRSARQVIAIASRAQKVRAEERVHGKLRPVAYTKGVGRWQVSFFRGKQERAQVLVDDRSGAVLEQWTGPQVAWTMARGYPGAFGRKLNAPYVWFLFCVLFLAPFVDPRRPFRLLHLDLLVLLAFGVSHFFFNRGEISTSVPLAYPVLAYLLVRCLLAALRPRASTGRLVPLAPSSWLVVGLVFLAAFRVGLNVVDSNVIDVGYAGTIGADRIADGHRLYGQGFSRDVEHGDTYGPLNYLLYVPFEQLMPWSGSWDRLPASHGAAITFDLLTLGGLLLLGRRLRPGPEGRSLGIALGYAWAAYPYSAFALESNSNDTLVALFCVAALLALTWKPGWSAVGRGAAIGAGAAAKFVPLALAPLFAAGTGERRWRDLLPFALALAAVIAVSTLPFIPDGGLREIYDRTVGYQTGRPSPFSIWGQAESLHWLQTVVKVAAAALAVLVAFVPRRRDLRQVAALGAAVIIALQLGVSHWFYLYIVWFVPFVLVATFGALGTAEESPGAEPRSRAAEPVTA
jgi:glycosyl transferase family 87